MAKKIAFIGAPATGKSTLAQSLVPQLKLAGVDAEICLEYARSYIRHCGPPQTPFEQFAILYGACATEDELDVHEVVVCDSGSFVGDVYYQFERMKNHADGNQLKLERGYQQIQHLARNRLLGFDLVFYVPLLDFIANDPTRVYLGDLKTLDTMLYSYLVSSGQPFETIVEQDHEKRKQEAWNIIAKHLQLDDTSKQSS